MQKITSAKTSRKQIPAAAKKIDWKPNTMNFDLGAGKYNEFSMFLSERKVFNLAYDPYNLDIEANISALGFVLENKGTTTATCFNVLNVIPEKRNIKKAVRLTLNALKDNGTAFFQVYEGDGSGLGCKTSCGWQNNMKKKEYEKIVDKIQKKEFPNVNYKFL